jgi:hypothetical protein
VCQRKITLGFGDKQAKLTIPITFTKQNKVRLLPTLSGKGDVDFVKLVQNRHHKKTVSTALPKAKTAFHQLRRHSFGIGIAELKVKPVEDTSPTATFIRNSLKSYIFASQSFLSVCSLHTKENTSYHLE